MKVLIDECVDVELRKHLPGHEAVTVTYLGWKGRRNGELIAAAESRAFDVLVTTDRSVPYQQHVAQLHLAVIAIHAPTNRFVDLKPFVAALLQALNHIRPATVVELR